MNGEVVSALYDSLCWFK